MAREQEPRPPRNVTATMRDGTRVPLECVYNGLNDGQHLWIATWILPEPPAQITCDDLDGKTKVALVMATNEEAAAIMQGIDAVEVVAAALCHGNKAAADPAPGRGGQPAS